MLQVLAARRVQWLVTLPLSVAILVLAASPVAAAGPRIAASGGVVQTSFVQSNVRSAGGVTLFDFTEHDSLSGTVSGTSVLQGSCVVRASGRGSCHAVETFTGTVAGQAGTAQFVDVFSINSAGAFQGRFVVVGGTGHLANLHGHGTFRGTGTTGTYSGRLFFAP